MIILGAVATTLLLAAGDPPPKKLDIHIDKVGKPDTSVPTLETGKVPKADGLKGESKSPESPQLKQTDGEAVTHRGAIAVEKVVHATEFTSKGLDQIPKGRPISELSLYSLPAHVPPFKSCFTLNSPDGMSTPIVVSFRSPSGETLLASRGQVVFDGPGKMDFVIDWAGFDVRSVGDYRITVQLGVQKPLDFTLAIRMAK
jgi:hypothetical protein